MYKIKIENYMIMVAIRDASEVASHIKKISSLNYMHEVAGKQDNKISMHIIFLYRILKRQLAYY